jgi:hypothetical protein
MRIYYKNDFVGQMPRDTKRIFGMILIVVASSIGLVTIGFQSTMAAIMLAHLEEVVEAGNATTMMTNQTANENMTGINSTS